MGVRRILVVDDCADTVETVSALYSILGFECRGARTGAAAIEAAMDFDPEVVLLDLGLPDLSGYEVARELRVRCTRGIYLAAFTGWGGTRIQQRTREVGFDQHVLKPIGKDALCRIVQRATRKRNAPKSACNSQPLPALRLATGE